MVEVGKGAAAVRTPRLKIIAGGRRKIGESAIPQVDQQAVGLAVGLFVVEFDIVVDVRIGGEEILEAVVVEIVQADSPSAASDRGRSDSAGPGHVRKEP